MTEEVLHCLLCSKIVGSRDSRGILSLIGGLVFAANGNYGSTLFDMDPGYLELYVCDDCLLEKQEHVSHVCENRPPVEFRVKSFADYCKEEEATDDGDDPDTPGVPTEPDPSATEA